MRPKPKAVRRYLAQFLSDTRVVELPRIAWKPILHGVVLRTRPRKSARAYEQVWTEEGSPLAAITCRQTDALAERLGPEIIVDYAMRYGNPSIRAGIDLLRMAGCDRILAAPLYPQYCAATTASAHDAIFAAIAALRWQPALRTLPPYHDDPLYIGALKASLERQLAALDFVPDRLLLSFHGMPQRTLVAWRSLSLPVPEDRAAARRSARPRGRHRLPVALRPRQMARTGDRQDARELIRRKASGELPSPRRDFRPIASKRWRKSASAAAIHSLAPAASISPDWIASTTAMKGWICSMR